MRRSEMGTLIDGPQAIARRSASASATVAQDGQIEISGILVKQCSRMPLGLVWLITVLAVWVVTTALIAVLIKSVTPRATASDLILQSMLSAAFASGVVGGPATAVALRIRRSGGLGRAALGGLGTAVLIMLFLWSYLEASGTPLTDAWNAVPPILIVAVLEMGLAFALRGRRVIAS
jgi:hypothetical protein